MSKLDDALKGLATQGINVSSLLTQQRNVCLDKMSTGMLSLDYILGGGYPKGRVIELFGMESSGKSCLSLVAIAEAQRRGEIAALIDSEGSFDPNWASKMGVDVDKLLKSQPDCGEDAFTAVERLAETGEVSLIVVDSVAALTPKAELEGEMTDQQVGLQARMIGKGLRKVADKASKTGTTIIFINQIRNKVGVVYGDPTITPGGFALKFYASLRLQMYKKEKIRADKDSPIQGHIMSVKVIKSKVSQPYLSADVELRFMEGINKTTDLIDAGVVAEVITKSGNTYMLGDKKLAVGYDALSEAIEGNEAVHVELRELVSAKLQALKGTPVSSVMSELKGESMDEGKPRKKRA